MLCFLFAMGSKALCDSAAASTQSKAASYLTGKDGYQLEVSGKMLVEAPFGNTNKAQQFLFKGAAIAPLFPGPVTIFDSYYAKQMLLVNASRLVFKASKSHNDWVAAVVGSLNLNQGSGARSNVREAYASLAHPVIGLINLGNTYGVEDRLVIGPRDITCGSGGVAGSSFFKFLPSTTGVLTYVGMAGCTNTATKAFYATNRVPEGLLKGLLFGFSYTPNTMHRGEMGLNVGYSPMREPFMPFDLNSLASGVNYLTQTEKASFGASFVYLMAGNTHSEKPIFAQDAKLATLNSDGTIATQGAPELIGNELDRCPTRSYQVGTACSLGNLSVSAEWIMNGNSHKLANDYNPVIYAEDEDGKKIVVASGINPPDLEVNNQQDTLLEKEYVADKAGRGQIWNVAVAYTLNSYKFSVSYMQSSVNTGFLSADQVDSAKATCSGWACGIDYNVMPGFTLYAEFGQFILKNPDWAYTATMIPSLTQFEYYGIAGSETPLTVFMVGAKLQF